MTAYFDSERKARYFAAMKSAAWVSWDRNLMCWVVTYV